MGAGQNWALGSRVGPLPPPRPPPRYRVLNSGSQSLAAENVGILALDSPEELPMFLRRGPRISEL